MTKRSASSNPTCAPGAVASSSSSVISRASRSGFVRSTTCAQSASSRLDSSISGRRRTDGQPQTRSRNCRASRMDRLRPANRSCRVSTGPCVARARSSTGATPRASGYCARALRSACSKQRKVQYRTCLTSDSSRSLVLGWNFSPKGYAGTAECPIPSELEVPLPDYGETLRPDFAVRELEPKDGASIWQLLVQVLEPGEDFDRVVRGHGQLEASAHGRMERLLRQTGVPAGLLFNGRALRLVSAPRGESSGWLDFRVGDMIQTAGRPISTALRLLLEPAAAPVTAACTTPRRPP